MCKCVVFGESGTSFENFPSSSFLFERAWLPYSFSLSLFFELQSFCSFLSLSFQQPMPLFIIIGSQRGYQHMSLMEQGVHKYRMGGCILLVQKQHIYLHGVYVILIKRYDKLLYLDQQGLTKLKTIKRFFLCRLIISEIIYLVLVGIFHHRGTSSKGFYLFVRTKLQVISAIPQTS